MNSPIAFTTKHDPEFKREMPQLNLPGPRIWKPKHLAEFFGFSVHWVYKITKSTSEDPPPRCQGIGRLAWDTESQAFQQWIIRRLRTIDDQEQDNV
ncbi:MAG TPA: hypothetical protein VF131_24335 [Blastocatellia bacterium]|nr:hypothetical protein [Blastocatellia bacterium]